MLPTGHIAAGLLLGARWARSEAGGRSGGSELGRPAVVGLAIAATCLPDADLAIPTLLDRLGVRHDLDTGRHHSWPTHTPVFWAGLAGTARRLAAHPDAPWWAPETADLLTAGVTIHLVQDTVANTVALLWPWRGGEYGLGLDRLAGVTDHWEYVRRYPATPAGLLESALILAATRSAVRAVRARRARRGGAKRWGRQAGGSRSGPTTRARTA